jgi:hypothetical protein
MIKITGSATRAFSFPAELPLAYAFYGDVSRLLNYLPHICLVRAYGADRFRLLYSTTELGAYHVRIFADVQTTLEAGWVLRVHPLEGLRPVEAKAGVNSTTAQGRFSSCSIFYNEGAQTRIEYDVELRATLPVPLGLRLMPRMMVNRIASSITKNRIREIVAGFIERSVDAYPYWLNELERDGGLAPENHQDFSQANAPCTEELPEIALTV